MHQQFIDIESFIPYDEKVFLLPEFKSSMFVTRAHGNDENMSQDDACPVDIKIQSLS